MGTGKVSNKTFRVKKQPRNKAAERSRMSPLKSAAMPAPGLPFGLDEEFEAYHAKLKKRIEALEASGPVQAILRECKDVTR